MMLEFREFVPFFGFEGLSSPLLFGTLLLLSTLVDGAVAHFILSGKKPLGIARVVVVLIVCGILFVPKVFVLGLFGVRMFGLMTVIWYDLIFVIPYCGIRALIQALRGRRLTGPVWVVAILALLFVPVAAYARWIEPYDLRLETTRVPVAIDRAGDGEIRVAVLADLQTDCVGAYEREAIDRILALAPDLILIPGDLFHGKDELFYEQEESLREQLARLSAPGGVFLVRGDVDPWERIDSLLKGTGIRLLEDEIIRIEVKGRPVTIGGVELDFSSHEAREVIGSLETEKGGTDLRILLCHRPDVVELLEPNSRIDLTIAGHTHGGQIVLPLYGPPLTLSRLPREVGAGGLHEIEGNRIYVSRGVGLERAQAPRIRFMAPPEISLLLVDGETRLP